MQVLKINFNSPNLNPKHQKVLSNQISDKVNFKGLNQDIFTKSTSFSNEKATELLKTKLAECMTPKELDFYMDKIQEICKKLEIEPKNLPIDEEHQGNLTDDQLMQISFLVKSDAILV